LAAREAKLTAGEAELAAGEAELTAKEAIFLQMEDEIKMTADAANKKEEVAAPQLAETRRAAATLSLVERDPEVDKILINMWGGTALHRAANRGNLIEVQDCLKRGANVNSKDNYGELWRQLCERRG